MNRIVTLIVVAICLCACGGGVKFASQSLNEALPNQLRERAALRKFATFQSNLPGLVGHFLYVRQDASGQCPNPIPDNYDASGVGLKSYVKPGVEMKPVSDAILRYQSKVDSKIAAQASVLVVAGTLNAQQTMEMVVTDTVTLALRDGDYDSSEVDGEFDKPLPSGTCARLFIRGAALSTVTYKTYQQIDADATSSGNAFKVGAQVYGKGESFSLDYVLGLEVYIRSPAGEPGEAPRLVFGEKEPTLIDDTH